MGVHKDAFAIFVVTDMEQAPPLIILPQDDHVPGAKALRNDIGEVQPLLHKAERLHTVPLHPLDDGDNKLRVNIGGLLNLLREEFRLRALLPLMQVLLYLVLAQFMRPGAFFRVHR